jgi:hypothetical protein
MRNTNVQERIDGSERMIGTSHAFQRSMLKKTRASLPSPAIRADLVYRRIRFVRSFVRRARPCVPRLRRPHLPSVPARELPVCAVDWILH